ncbi:NADH-quinone oxidoreductase subunit NuoE [Deinococcus humi]|uniref:NADH-quinone oxidoreductase subunit E n=1 Tax=Deinococcus humi TaxID=662880 RepID=A0A7W8JU26_9DEIO|nr:NADH-quinone oxidoreductase subunit NuoE [Deinococcus humi]MBB5363277.1 NADH-quinone oxidoreductase subunit E [Deinococcus humi]GGO27327.1 NADH-quinone oxidoreductase [Deinococcus humi]
MSYFADKQTLVADIFSRYPDSPQGRRSALMPLLREVQDAEGFVSGSRMDEIAALCGTTATEVRSVMSFYSTYHTLPTGKYHLQVCSTVMCSLAGSDELWDHLVSELDVQPGEVSPDGRFSVQKVECLGSCGTAPLIQINDDGYYEKVTPGKCASILKALRADLQPLPDNPVPVTVNAEGRQVLASGEAVGASVTGLNQLPPFHGGEA